MASSGKKRKQQAVERRAKRAAQPPSPHPDGDRRRRGFGERVDDALKRKAALRQAWLDAPADGRDDNAE